MARITFKIQELIDNNRFIRERCARRSLRVNEIIARQHLTMTRLRRSYGKNLDVFTTCRHERQLQRLRRDLCLRSRSPRVLHGHLMNSWERYLIGCQAGRMDDIVCPQTGVYSYVNDLVSFGSGGSRRRSEMRSE